MPLSEEDETEALWQKWGAPEPDPTFVPDVRVRDAWRAVIAQQGINPEWRPSVTKTCVELLSEPADYKDPFEFVPCVIAADDPTNEPGINALADKHPFYWDKLINFRAEPDHRYWFVDESVMPRYKSSTGVESVTAIYGAACTPFTDEKSDEISGGMARRARDNAQFMKPDTFAKLSSYVKFGRLDLDAVDALRAQGRGRKRMKTFDDLDGNKKGAFDELAVNALELLEAEFGHITRKGVQDDWATAGPLGTIFHAQVERTYNGVPQKPGWDTPEYRQFLDFESRPEHSRAMIHRTEHNLFYAPLRITGQADALFKTEIDKVFDIYDWKRVPDLDKAAHFTDAFLRAFPSYGRTKFHMYALQLNLYLFCYMAAGVEIRNMYICQFHPKLKTWIKRQVPRCPAQVVWLLERRQERLAVALALQ